MKKRIFFNLLGLLLLPGAVHADTATWNSSPIDGEWGHANNWTPAKVPKQYDTAVFGASSVTNVTISLNVLLEELVFAPGADEYAITLEPVSYLYFETVGITNNSGRVQNFVVPASTFEIATVVQFFDDASAGSQSVFTLEGASSTGRSGQIFFNDQSSAGDAVFVCKGATGPNFSEGGTINFLGSTTAADATFMVEGGAGTGGGGGSLNIGGNFSLATAANATIIAEGNTAVDASGGGVGFLTQATAGSATIVANGGQAAGSFGGAVIDFIGASAGGATFTINGALAEGAAGAKLLFDQDAHAADATCIINGGTGNLLGGRLILQSTSTGDRARVEVFGNGSLNLSGHSAPGVSIGSLEGNGVVLLGNNMLTTGTNNLTTEFSGQIQDAGSLTKIGNGTLLLSGANSYAGGTTVNAGTLSAGNTTGSATGTGAVKANTGTLGGRGIIAGPTTVGTGSGAGAFLDPAVGSHKPTTLTLQSALTLNSDATYTYTFKAKMNRARTDLVVANGVTINGATLDLMGQTQGSLNTGLTLTVLSNTSATPINGTFSNLPEGATVNVNGNSLQASYSGGDGNDLTLTVVP